MGSQSISCAMEYHVSRRVCRELRHLVHRKSTWHGLLRNKTRSAASDSMVGHEGGGGGEF